MGHSSTLGFSQKLSTEKDSGAKSRRTGIGLDLREADVCTAVHLDTNIFFYARSLSPPDWGHQKWNSEGEGASSWVFLKGEQHQDRSAIKAGLSVAGCARRGLTALSGCNTSAGFQ